NLGRIQDAGASAVEYLVCDVPDARAVEQVMDTIHTATGRIDLLINAAGLNRSAPISAKDFDEFREIRDVKLLAYTNLVAALANRPPRMWGNFGSLLGVSGQVGEVDYASANDFLGTAALTSERSGRNETTMAWTLWGEVGMGANPLTKAYFDRTRQYSNMTTEEGIGHFLRELR
ncbi:SDR family NAD(P)-dependent oxidoreductase, partial [Nocardia gipuzkoensis]